MDGFSRPREPGHLPGAGPSGGGGADLLVGTTPSEASSHLFCGVWAPHCFRTSALTASTSLVSADPPQVKAGGRLAPSPASVGTLCAWAEDLAVCSGAEPLYLATLRLPWWLSSKESACQCRIPGSGRSPGEGNGNPLQYSCLRNPMERGA